MKEGDLVRYRKWFYDFDLKSEPLLSEKAGLVLQVSFWKDSGAPDRNFGVDVKVLWSDGVVRSHEEDELETIFIDEREKV